MKNVFKVIIISLLIISINSCTQESKVLNQKPKIHLKENPSGNFLVITASDLGGALSGALTGASAGKTMYPNDPNAAKIGAAIGAIIGGASASIKTWSGLSKPTGNTGATGAGGVCYNSGNSLDYVGENHYLSLMDSWIPDFNQVSYSPYEYASDYLSYNSAVSKLISDGVIIESDTQFFTLQDLRDQTEILENYTDSSFISFVSYLYNEEIIGLHAFDILEDYLSVLDTASTVEIFIAYSIGIEEDVEESTTLSVVGKQSLLAYMSTMRWGLYFWSEE